MLHRNRNPRVASAIRFVVWCLWAAIVAALLALAISEGRVL